jgi:hypothetical protein
MSSDEIRRRSEYAEALASMVVKVFGERAKALGEAQARVINMTGRLASLADAAGAEPDNAQAVRAFEQYAEQAISQFRGLLWRMLSDDLQAGRSVLRACTPSPN